MMMNNGIWTEEEHDRFLYAIKHYPKGPWSTIAEFVGTRSVRQVQTHTQKYYEKIMRRMRGLQRGRKTWARLEHRIEDDILEFCKIMSGPRVAAEIASHMVTSATGGTGTGSGRASPVSSEASTLRAASPTQETKRSSSSSRSSSTSSSPSGKQQMLPEPETMQMLDVEDEQFFELPSLEESLDFFIASLEHDASLQHDIQL
ncbi:Myb-like dna-binding protein [Globisporangium polare]